jgi:hypothetical protein
MGLRLHIHLGHGVGVSFGRGGARLYASGRRGATVNIGKRGIRGTVGLPGTGLSYSESAPWHHRAGHAAKSNAAPLIGLVMLVALAALLIATR